MENHYSLWLRIGKNFPDMRSEVTHFNKDGIGQQIGNIMHGWPEYDQDMFQNRLKLRKVD